MIATFCQDPGVWKKTRVAVVVTHGLPSGQLRTQMQRVQSRVFYFLSATTEFHKM